jgi:signal recognition particle receptor subunit beta
MSSINPQLKTVTIKVVFCGPGKAGKTTNVQTLYNLSPEEARSGEVRSIQTSDERTLFCDLASFQLGDIPIMCAGQGGVRETMFRVRLQLFSVPGQPEYQAVRKRILQGVDAVVFVADSSIHADDANRESLRDLWTCLTPLGQWTEPEGERYIPVVLQYNKRDMPDASTIEALHEDLNPDAPHGGFAWHEAVATTGEGVIATVTTAARAAMAVIQRTATKQAHRASGMIQAPVQPVGKVPGAMGSGMRPAQRVDPRTASTINMPAAITDPRLAETRKSLPPVVLPDPSEPPQAVIEPIEVDPPAATTPAVKPPTTQIPSRPRARPTSQQPATRSTRRVKPTASTWLWPLVIVGLAVVVGGGIAAWLFFTA